MTERAQPDAGGVAPRASPLKAQKSARPDNAVRVAPSERVGAYEQTLAMRGFTGRYIVVFSDLSTGDAIASLKSRSGLHVATSSDFAGHVAVPAGGLGSAMYLEALGIAIAEMPPDQSAGLGISALHRYRIVPERFMFAAGSLRLERSYLEGYRDGIAALVDDLLHRPDGSAMGDAMGPGLVASGVNDEFTWNLGRTGAAASRFSGRGVKLAVLDTGYDQTHPDFEGRVSLAQSFVPGSSLQDVFGHGTHCLGTVAGRAKPVSAGPRYGCAGDVELLVGKVLGDDGQGDEGWLLNGINWALENGADIVSLSVEGPYDPASAVLPQYEAIGSRALDAGRLIVAAAGNYSIRPLVTRPVASPACAASILSVGATGPDDRVASFSCAGTTAAEVDLAAPGVSIESSFPMPRMRKTDSGTSMAAPLVAGIAALHMEATPGLRGRALWDKLKATARALPDAREDVGAGCATAP